MAVIDTKRAAAKLIADGFPVIPLQPNTKNRPAPEWSKTSFTVDDFKDDDNVAVRLDKHVVIDTEDRDTTALAHLLLPITMEHGRASNPGSHLWYHAHPDAKFFQYRDVTRSASGDHQSILDVLTGRSRYVVVPPSIHPSGESYVGDDATILKVDDYGVFWEHLVATAIGGLVFRHWDAFGHDSMAQLAGMLLQHGLRSDLVKRLFTSMGAIGPGRQHAADFIPYVERTVTMHANGEQIAGRQKLIDSVPSELVDRILSWLPKRKAEAPRVVRFTTADTITPRSVEWAWDQWIPLGSVGLLGGREGLGKSLAIMWQTAQLTRGALLGQYFGQPRTVLIAATEDSWEHTIAPRLLAANADMQRVVRLDVETAEGVDELQLPVDLAGLQQRIVENGEVAAMYLDPLLSRLSGKLDTHKDAEVRRALEPLVRLADATGIFIIGLIHVNKSNSNDPLNSIMGSRAFTAVSRFVHFVIEDPNDDSIRLYGLPKNNLGPRNHETKTFQVVEAPVTLSDLTVIKTSRIDWTGTDPRSIRQILQEANDMKQPNKTGDALRWLLDYLNQHNGAAESSAVKTDGKAAGHSPSTLKNAARTMNLQQIPGGFPRKTWWALPGVQFNLTHLAGQP